MAEGTYESECMRAELLGIEKPDYDEFMRNKVENENTSTQEEDLDLANLQEIDLHEEGTKRITGGLEELNNILQKTQSKLSRFRSSCGSLTNLLKVKIVGKPNDNCTGSPVRLKSDRVQIEVTQATDTTTTDTIEEAVEEDVESSRSENGSVARRSDLSKALNADLSKLDLMIEKAENAQYSMAHQSKQMKKFLN